MTTQEYDAIIIGAGQAGGPLASALAGAGKRVAIVEREHVGGTCINEGCTPTKTMIASGRVAYLAHRGADYGVQMGPITIDQQKIRQRKRDIVDSFRGGSESQLIGTDGVTLLRGEASFSGPKVVEMQLNDGGSVSLHADLIVINAGERPGHPNLPGIDEVPYLNSTSIMELDQVPEHLIILGGGYIGLEFGQLFRRLGGAVTIVQRGARLLAREDADVSDAVADILREDGIAVLTGTAATRVAHDGAGVVLTVRDADGERTIHGSHLLAAAGRTPNSDRLNLAAAGIATDKRGYITVDERLATNVAGIYAVGDIKGGPAFTHISYDDFRILRTNLIQGGDATTTDRLVPYTVFTDPQLGRVGLSETMAKAQGRKVRIAKMPMSSVARALEVDESRGFMKVLIDGKSDQIVGAAILGLEGGEIMSMIQIAMMGKLPYTTLRDATFAHPTLAESLNNLFSNVE
ncbi:MAG TPA: mercuric reductase [Thermomicrobiales bacterium]|jgi:pyruvate/2-oxoglutarate dehydrogenase complex dihydrolipoamide dehydrogenase (E3) component